MEIHATSLARVRVDCHANLVCTVVIMPQGGKASRVQLVLVVQIVWIAKHSHIFAFRVANVMKKRLARLLLMSLRRQNTRENCV